MFKLAMITGVLALSVSAFAADKPAVSARTEMESVPAAATIATDAGGGYVVERSMVREPRDVGFTRNRAVTAEQTFTAPSGGSGKAAVDFRLNQGR